jgi:hypothetical protein
MTLLGISAMSIVPLRGSNVSGSFKDAGGFQSGSVG